MTSLKLRALALAGGLAAVLAAAPARADRPVTAEERTRVEAVLRQGGFVRWEKIEVEGDANTLVEVDDAYTADGRRFDLWYALPDLREVDRKAE